MLASIATIALCCTSCASYRTSASRQTTASTHSAALATTTLRRIAPLPPTVTHLTAKIDDVLLLPEGAEYSTASDGVRATVRRMGDSLVVEASADMTLTEEFTATARSDTTDTSQTMETKTTASRTGGTLGLRLKWYTAGILTGIIGFIIIKRKIKNFVK